MVFTDCADADIAWMDDETIRGFLSSHDVGVLALPSTGSGLPCLRPLSYWFDGDERLYFGYLLGAASRKVDHSRRTARARFLVYSVETADTWRSVLLTGPIEEVPRDEREGVEAAADFGRRPAVLERLSEKERTTLYSLRIDEQVGIEHVDLPKPFRTKSTTEPPKHRS